ncbi:S-antigen protein [Amphibalanus amphitrite]|uniref:S-antigen protein n=1 Tax=Amphibalanus amphitrite TaxID=1232801 RepID=A0A6A4UY86_AMPAM|nr:S-antigen protein [Amphibalanus amphitrite]
MAAPSAARRALLVGASLLPLLLSVSASDVCGPEPTVIHVAKGEKKHVKFWNTEEVPTTTPQPADITDTVEICTGHLSDGLERSGDSHSPGCGHGSAGPDSSDSKSPTNPDSQSSASPEDSDKQSPASAEGSDKQSSASPEGSDKQSSTGPEGSDSQISTGPEGSDSHSSAGPEGSDGQSATSPEASDSQSSAGPEGSDKQSSTSPEGSDSQSSAGPEGSDSQSSAGPEGSDSQSSASPEGSDKQSSTGPEGSDSQSSAGTEGSDSQISTGPEGSDSQISTSPEGSDDVQQQLAELSALSAISAMASEASSGSQEEEEEGSAAQPDVESPSEATETDGATGVSVEPEGTSEAEGAPGAEVDLPSGKTPDVQKDEEVSIAQPDQEQEKSTNYYPIADRVVSHIVKKDEEAVKAEAHVVSSPSDSFVVDENSETPEPSSGADESQLEGSGVEEQFSASATIPLNKYHEIRIPLQDGEAPGLSFEGSGEFAAFDVGSETDIEDDHERLLKVTDINDDKVTLEWTPDREGSGDFTLQFDSALEAAEREGSGDFTLQFDFALEAPEEEGSGVVADQTADLGRQEEPLSADAPGAEVEAPKVHGSANHDPASPEEEQDELLPVAQLQPEPSETIYHLLSSLPLGRPAADATADQATAHVEEQADAIPYQAVSQSDDTLTSEERLLLVQGLEGDRVILQHIPDEEEGSGSATFATDLARKPVEEETEASGQAYTDTAFEAPGETDRDATVEASGDSALQEEEVSLSNESEGTSVNSGAQKYSGKHPLIREETWVTEESDIIAPEVHIPAHVESELQAGPVSGPVVRGTEQLAQVEKGVVLEELPVAKTDGDPLPQVFESEEQVADEAGTGETGVEVDISPDESELEKSESNSNEEEMKSTDSVNGNPDVTEDKEETATSEANAAATEDGSKEDQESDNENEDVDDDDDDDDYDDDDDVSTDPLSLLSSVYRFINGDQNTPLWPPKRPAWIDFSSPMMREVISGAVQDSDESATHETIVVGQGPYFELFIRSQPYPFVSALLHGTGHRGSRKATSAVDCEWQIKTEPHLYLLVTVNNLSAPYTVDCDGAYIEVERERDGFEARWCGNRIKQASGMTWRPQTIFGRTLRSGSRPHMVFARGEVRIAVFNDGNTTQLPTGFEADVEVVDLLDARQYATFRRSGLNFRQLGQDPVLPQ